MSRLCLTLSWEMDLKFVGLRHPIGVGCDIVSRDLGVPREELRLRALGMKHSTRYPFEVIKLGDFQAVRDVLSLHILFSLLVSSSIIAITGL